VAGVHGKSAQAIPTVEHVFVRGDKEIVHHLQSPLLLDVLRIILGACLEECPELQEK
jgi:hypothetical protein